MSPIIFKVSPLKPFLLAALMLTAGAGVWVVLGVDFSDPYFSPSTLFIPGFFVLCALLMLAFGIRLASAPILTTDDREMRFGIWRTQTLARAELQGARFDGRALLLQLRDGTTRGFTPALYGRDLARIATLVDRWARG